MKSEARVRWKMDTVNVQAEKMVVVPANQIHGLLETEVGAAWLRASTLPLLPHTWGLASTNQHPVTLGCFAFSWQLDFLLSCSD